MTNLTITPATKSDVPEILRLIRELAEYEHLEHEVKATEDILERTLFGPKPYAETLLARVGGEVAGFCLFYHNFSTFLGRPGIYIEDIFVRPQHRGKGIGTSLFNELIALAKSRDCGRLEWWVLNWNKSAITFYKNMGAAAMDEWVVYRLSQF